MKRVTMCWALLSLASLSFAQEKGIKFEQAQNWEQILQKAKSENKFIFLDLYATWCAPCKEMDKNVYTDEAVGAFMNEKFLSVKIQVDKTSKDNDLIKLWYNDAEMIMTQYSVGILPGLLFFSPQGVLAKNSSGAVSTAGLIALAKESIGLAGKYNVRIDSLKQGKLSYPAVKELATEAKTIRDSKTAEMASAIYINDYLLSLPEKELFEKDNLLFIWRFLGGPETRAYQLFLKQPEKVNDVLGEYQAQYAIMNYIERKHLPKKSSWNKDVPDWSAIEKNITRKFGALGTEATLSKRMIYYEETKNWKAYEIWYKKYLEKNYKHPQYDLNYLSWILFENSNNPEILKFACDTVMKYAMEKWYQNNAACYDTYANLLYKTGRKEKAIEWQEKAVKLSNNDSVLVETLNKMRRNEKTWPN